MTNQKMRPPIVSVLGHVDHGKTTLLDKIRKTDVQRKEAGGITQSIGASQITTKEGMPAQAGKRITFVDTPGHAAFSAMRSRGVNAADIVILVVAANDGVKPQTKEALDHIQKSGIPFVVAFTKIDLPSASVDSAIKQLESEDVKFEGRGGDTPKVLVSGKTGEGIGNLLEIIHLVAEVNDIKADAEGPLEAVVIETSIAKEGPRVSAVVKNGTLSVGQEISASGFKAKVRGLFNDRGVAVKIATPGDPIAILGFTQLPPVGSVIGEKDTTDKKDIEFSTPKELKEGQIALVLKAGNFGALEAATSNLPHETVVVSSGVGDVNESDIMLAKSSGATIFAYTAKVGSSVKKYAETEGVKIEQFDIIYEFFDKVKEIIEEGKVKEAGKAEIVAEFPYNRKKIAGCRVVGGVIQKNTKVSIMRDQKILGEAFVASLKKGKEDIKFAKEGEECGILLKPQLDFAIGDVLLSVRK